MNLPKITSTKIALSMISKGRGEEKHLQQALASIAEHVDAIYLTFTEPKNLLTEALQIAKQFNAIVSYYPTKKVMDQKTVDWLTEFFGYAPHMKVDDKLFLFDDARNFNLSQIPKDFTWFVWMDTDDVFIGGENLHMLAQQAAKQNMEAVYFNYVYQAEFNEQGQVTGRLIEHLRERLIRNNDHFKWVAPIHETLIAQVPVTHTDIAACEVLHTASEKGRTGSLQRNLNNLEYAIFSSEGKDPRPVYYLAKALFDLNTPTEDDNAIHLILRYLNGDEKGEHKSGWPEERMQAWEYLAEIYRRKGQHNNALKCALNALTEPCEPKPDIFVSIALTHLIQGNNDLALFWVKNALQIPEQKTTLVKNPKDFQLRVLQVIFNASLNLNMVDEAWGAAVKMRDLAPNDPEAQRAYAFAQDLRDTRDMTMKVAQIADYLDKHGETHKIKALLQATPAIAEKTPFYADMVKKIIPPRSWADDEVAIFCGPGYTNWSPKQLTDPKGSFIGGSEEAVINLAKELQGEGWKVTVYNDPGADEGEFDGVKYVPHYTFNAMDKFNIVIGWRQFLPDDLVANKRYFWAHDILNGLEFTPERLEKLEKVIVLSDYHRKTIANVPDEKIMISSNGI